MPRKKRAISGLYVVYGKCHGDEEARRVYDSPSVHRPMWLVCCDNPRDPRRSSLPVGFATLNDAHRAMHALIEARLHTPDALHQRIKVDMDWKSVKRIMIEALAW